MVFLYGEVGILTVKFLFPVYVQGAARWDGIFADIPARQPALIIPLSFLSSYCRLKSQLTQGLQVTRTQLPDVIKTMIKIHQPSLIETSNNSPQKNLSLLIHITYSLF